MDSVLIPTSDSTMHCCRWRLVKTGWLSCRKMPGPRTTISGFPARPDMQELELVRARVWSRRVLSAARKDCKLKHCSKISSFFISISLLVRRVYSWAYGTWTKFYMEERVKGFWLCHIFNGVGTTCDVKCENFPKSRTRGSQNEFVSWDATCVWTHKYYVCVTSILRQDYSLREL